MDILYMHAWSPFQTPKYIFNILKINTLKIFFLGNTTPNYVIYKQIYNSFSYSIDNSRKKPQSSFWKNAKKCNIWNIIIFEKSLEVPQIPYSALI